MSVKLTTRNAEIVANRHSGDFEIDTNLEISEIIDQIGEGKILDEIGRDSCIKHFDIEEQE